MLAILLAGTTLVLTMRAVVASALLGAPSHSGLTLQFLGYLDDVFRFSHVSIAIKIAYIVYLAYLIERQVTKRAMR